MTYVTCYIQGGLGNQLFIIFTTIATAIKNKMEYFIIDQDESPSATPRTTYFKTLLSKLKLQTYYKEPVRQFIKEIDHMKHQEFSTISTNAMLQGYFQSRKYFDDIKPFIIDHLTLSPKDQKYLQVSHKIIRENAKNRKCIFIHIRRQDYLKYSNVHYNIPMEWYLSAIEEHKQLYDCYFVVFSDDIKFCKEFFSQYICKSDIYFVNGNKDYIELMLMSEMDGAIIANSSFSWWGAYLMEIKKEKEDISPFIISPKKWFSNVSDDKENDRNVERKNWKFL